MAHQADARFVIKASRDGSRQVESYGSKPLLRRSRLRERAILRFKDPAEAKARIDREAVECDAAEAEAPAIRITAAEDAVSIPERV